MPLPAGRQAAHSPDDARVRQIHASGMRKLSTSGGLTASTSVAIAASVAFSASVTGGRPRIWRKTTAPAMQPAKHAAEPSSVFGRPSAVLVRAARTGDRRDAVAHAERGHHQRADLRAEEVDPDDVHHDREEERPEQQLVRLARARHRAHVRVVLVLDDRALERRVNANAAGTKMLSIHVQCDSSKRFQKSSHEPAATCTTLRLSDGLSILRRTTRRKSRSRS